MSFIMGEHILIYFETTDYVRVIYSLAVLPTRPGKSTTPPGGSAEHKSHKSKWLHSQKVTLTQLQHRSGDNSDDN